MDIEVVVKGTPLLIQESRLLIPDNMSELIEDIRRHPAYVAEVGFHTAVAREEFLQAEADLQALCGKLFYRYRQELSGSQFNITDGATFQKVYKDTDYIAKQKEVITKRGVWDKLRYVMTALDHKKELSVQVNTVLKQERALS